MQRPWKSLLSVLSLSLLFMNCSDVKFDKKKGADSSLNPLSGENGEGRGGGEFGEGVTNIDRSGGIIQGELIAPGHCTEEIRKVEFPLKFVIVVDASTSNIDNTGTSQKGDGTDPKKQFRLGSVKGLHERMIDKDNFAWSLMSFRDLYDDRYPRSFSHIKINNNDQLPGFANDAQTVSAAIDEMGSVNDNGLTPYGAALSMAQKAIELDLNSADPDTRYVVLFITDGMPTDTTVCKSKKAGGDTEVLFIDSLDPCPGDKSLAIVDEERVFKYAEDIKNTKPGYVSVNTIYYGLIDSNKDNNVWRLKQMAEKGSGYFYDASTAHTIKIEDVIQVQGVKCNKDGI